MSKRHMMQVTLPGADTWVGGYAEDMPADPSKLIADMRRRAAMWKADCEAILAAADADFRIVTYRGIHVQDDKRVIQAGRG